MRYTSRAYQALLFLSAGIIAVGEGFDQGMTAVFHYVGACANVFCMNQLRMGEWSPAFQSTNLGITCLQVLGWAVPPLLLQTGRIFSVRYRKSIIYDLNKAYSVQVKKEMAGNFVVHNTWTDVHDILGAIGEGIKLANVLPLLITLLNVYTADLNEMGAIKNTWVWMAYVGVFCLSAALFTCKQFAVNRKESQQIAREFIETCQEKISDPVSQSSGAVQTGYEAPYDAIGTLKQLASSDEEVPVNLGFTLNLRAS